MAYILGRSGRVKGKRQRRLCLNIQDIFANLLILKKNNMHGMLLSVNPLCAYIEGAESCSGSSKLCLELIAEKYLTMKIRISISRS